MFYLGWADGQPLPLISIGIVWKVHSFLADVMSMANLNSLTKKKRISEVPDVVQIFNGYTMYNNESQFQR